ncbi:MAG: type III-B CRISPR-associated protein Cas10/Cmr2, partial [Lentisphaeria bacterium]
QDTLWNRILAEKNKAGEKSDANAAAKWLLTPTLPNRFLAVVPAERAEMLALATTTALQDELRSIGDAVWQWLAGAAAEAGCQGLDHWKLRWDAQLRSFPQISWAVQPWLEREECLKELAKLPINRNEKDSPLETLQNTLRLAEEWIDKTDRDKRYYIDHDVTKPLQNSGIFWSAHYALVDAKLAARRNTHVFSAWENPWPEASVKDSLSGKEEIIGDEKFWKYLNEKYGKSEKNARSRTSDVLFSAKTHKYGAMNLLKRLWCRDDHVDYLRKSLGLPAEDFRKAVGFESVEEVAIRNRRSGKYVAVLAMDGDEMGKWVSGQKTPTFLDQLSDPAQRYLEPILKDHGCKDLRRVLSPSYHLQFSEALANFATWLARPIVEAFGGQLIYAGGDDVLAMLPADQAIGCARALRAVFRGEEPEAMSSMSLNVDGGGFVTAGAGYPLLVPGSKADVSIGLAIGHFQAPLQMLVKEAQAAEHRAKQEYGRGAIAFSLYKRSGEIIQWGCKWNSPALPLMELLDRLSPQATQVSGELSDRFPYALAALLQPYQLDRPLTVAIEDMRNIIQREVEHIISRQGRELIKAAEKKEEAKKRLEELQELIFSWLDQCVAGDLARKKRMAAGAPSEAVGSLGDFIQPFLTETFINRGLGGEV